MPEEKRSPQKDKKLLQINMQCKHKFGSCLCATFLLTPFNSPIAKLGGKYLK
jgi:hypothetical protein